MFRGKNKVLLLFFIAAISCNKSSSNNNGGGGGGGTPAPAPVFAKGADISWLTEMEAEGRLFYNSSGTAQDCFQILKNLGMNSIRLRVWVDPAGGW